VVGIDPAGYRRKILPMNRRLVPGLYMRTVTICHGRGTPPPRTLLVGPDMKIMPEGAVCASTPSGALMRSEKIGPR